MRQIVIENDDEQFDLALLKKDVENYQLSFTPLLIEKVQKFLDVSSFELKKLNLTFSKLGGFGGAAHNLNVSLEAQVGRTCGVSLEAFDQILSEEFDAIFVNGPDPSASMTATKVEDENTDVEGIEGSFDPDAPFYVASGQLQLYDLVLEWLSLGLDPYPVKPGARWQSDDQINDEESVDPRFAKLQALKNSTDDAH